jgi:hypothetical protein
MRMASASFVISRKDRPNDSWGCSYQKKPKPKPPKEPEQYQLFDTLEYGYRVFVTNLNAPIDVVAGFYRQWARAGNLINEANSDAGLAAHPSARGT